MLEFTSTRGSIDAAYYGFHSQSARQIFQAFRSGTGTSGENFSFPKKHLFKTRIFCLDLSGDCIMPTIDVAPLS